jgi:hypothetical protein
MRLSARLLGALIISGIQALADAHRRGHHNHHDHSDNDIDMNHNIDHVDNDMDHPYHHAHHHQHQGNLRSLGIFDNVAESLFSNRPCKDGEPNFTVGNVTYACKADFYRKGGVCGTSAMSSDRRAKSDEHFNEWLDIKKWHDHRDDSQKEGGETKMRRSLGGCVDCVDWSTTIITVPTYVHVIHSGTTGKQFTYTSNPSYIRNQIKALNIGFRGETNIAFTPYPGRSYPRYNAMDADTRIRFCLAGTTATDNASWYNAKDDYAMKTALKKGGSESLNVYVNTAGGFLGYAYFPESQDFLEDGVVILNDSMPGGAAAGYNEGDTLTHEVGHWLELDHTHGSGCAGPGDYMNLAPPSTNYKSVKSCESTATGGCPTTLNNCASDGGKNPIHNFMSYSDVSIDQYIILSCFAQCSLYSTHVNSSYRTHVCSASSLLSLSG